MKHYLNVFISLTSVVILLISSDFLLGETTNCYDFGTNSELTQNMQTADFKSLNDEGLRQHAILWDTTHGIYLNYNPFVRYSDLVAMLADSGYTLECCGTGVHTVDLSQYDVIVITVFGSWNSPYTQEEVDSLVSYYNQGHQRIILTGDGNFCENAYFYIVDNVQFTYNIFDWLSTSGGIFIVGDNFGCNNANINPVANAFNMTAGLTNIVPADLYFTNFAAQAIFVNVAQIYYRAAGEVSASSPSEVLAWTDNNEPVIAGLDEYIGIKDEDNYEADFQKIKIEPNPFTYNTVLKGTPDASRINIYDVSGRLVENLEGNTIGENLKQGIYFVEIEGYEPLKIIKLKW